MALGEGEPSTDVSNTKNNWPLHKISEPHECNDVLLSVPEGSTSQRNNSENKHDQTTEPPIPWRSIQLRSATEGSNPLRGNQRFFELLLQHQEEYESRPQMEKPLVTVQVLQLWRNQSPPGRFLTVETNTNPPLWKDIGDKKARSKISKALKHLTMTHGSASLITGNQLLTQQSTASASPTFSGQRTETVGPDLIDIPSQVELRDDRRVSTLRMSGDLPPTGGSVTPEREESKFASEGPELITSLGVSAPVKHALSHQVAHRSILKEEEEEKRTGEPRELGPSNFKPPRIPARFRKPEKYVRRISEQLHSAQEGGSIYGRWSERDQLLSIYERQKQQTTIVDMVLISGLMGVGKSSLAQTLKNPLTDNDCGYGDVDDDDVEWPFFLQGKFEHSSWSDPNAFFVSIVSDFCKQLDERNDSTLTRLYRNALVNTLKDDVILLSNLVPALATLLKNPHHRRESCGAMDNSNTCCESPLDLAQGDSFACMATQRIKDVFGKFLQTIASINRDKHAVIVVLDDMHWASESAIDVFTSLATSRTSAGVLFIGTYRDDEADEPYFKKAQERWNHNQNVQVTNLHLCNLKKDSVHVMLSEALSLEEEQTMSLNNLVFSLTKGNPIFITELLRIFQDKGVLNFDDTSQQWTCELQQIPLVLGDIGGVPDLFKAKLLDLPSAIQETLKIAACIGCTEVNESLLKMIDTIGSVKQHLQFADIKGLLAYRNGQYEFVSDGVKQATYGLIPVAERSSYHLKIGQRLWLHLEENENPAFYALLMHQMFLGDDKITEDQDRRAVASLCLQAAQGAAKHVGFQTAWLCLSHGISIVSAQKTWGRENYDLSLRLYNTAIEVCYCNGEFSELQNLIEEVLENARTFEDSLLARSTQIYSLGSRNKQMEAIQIGLETLKQLGEGLPSIRTSRLRVYLEFRRVKSLLRGLSDEDILKLPRMKDPKKLAAMQILNHVILSTMYAAPNLSALVALRMIELTVKSGLSAIASVGFALFGTMLCRFDDIDGGYRYGKLSLKLGDKFKTAVWLCRTWAGYYGTVHNRKHSVHEVFEPLRTAYRAGMQAGDVEFAMLSACLVCWNASEVVALPELESEICELADQAEFYGQSLSLVMLKPLWQAALNWMGKVPGDPKIMQGELIDDDVEKAKGGNNPHFLIWVRFLQMKSAYLFGDYDLAEKYVDAAPQIYNNSTGAMDSVYTMTYECLTLLAQARQGKRRFRRILYVKRCLKRLKFWATHAPMNFLGKQFLLEAELASVQGNGQKANSHYRSAILHSRETGFYLEEALANQKLGVYYLEQKDEESAIPFLRAARDVFEKWGACALVNHFEDEFGGLLSANSK